MRIKNVCIIGLLVLAGCSIMGGVRGSLDRANKYYEADRYDDALREYSSILSEDPNNVEAHFRRAVIFQKQKNYDPAIREYNETIRLDPSHAKAHFNLGLLYSYDKVDYVKAIYFMERFVELDPEHAYVPDAKKRIEEMKKKVYGGKEDEGGDSGSLLDVTDELSK
jgi:tetratricopeptide (TPR) repeat protein